MRDEIPQVFDWRIVLMLRFDAIYSFMTHGRQRLSLFCLQQSVLVGTK